MDKVTECKYPHISTAEAERLIHPERYDAKLKEVSNSSSHIHVAKHAIGLDHATAYKRHGKLFYRPYRNYYQTYYDDPLWRDLSSLGFAECDTVYWEAKKKKNVMYWLNRDGLNWLGDILGITIHDERR